MSQQQKPRFVIRVADLSRSIAFYRVLGCEPEWQEGSVAQLLLPNGTPMLVAQGTEIDVRPWLQEHFTEGVPGKRIYMFGKDVRAIHDRLAASGAPGLVFDEGVTGLEIAVLDPDGYIPSLYEELPMSDEAILDLYRSGPDLLEKALAGLTEADLDLSRAPGKWTIRQLTLHMIDSDFGSAYRMRFALAEPGRPYATNSYNQDRWAEGLDYAHRPVEPEVTMFRAIRAHILGLVNHLGDGALDRAVMINGKPSDIRGTLKLLGGHVSHHVGHIWETRKVHGKA